MARATVGNRFTDRTKELKALADRTGGSGEEGYLQDCANDYVALQMFKRLSHRKGATGEADEALTWLLRRAADALLRGFATEEGVQWRLRDMLPGRKGRRGVA